MTKDEIEKWAREVDCTHVNLIGDRTAAIERLSRFADLIASLERERCAKLVETPMYDWMPVYAYQQHYAEAIRTLK